MPVAANLFDVHERYCRRRQTIETLHQMAATYRSQVQSYVDACRDLFGLFSRLPPAVIYEYGATKRRLLHVVEALRAHQQALAEGTLLPMFARQLIADLAPDSSPQHCGVSPKELRQRAAALVERELERNEAKLRALVDLRRALESAAKKVVERTHVAARLGCIDHDARPVIELEAFTEFCFPGSVVHGRVAKDVRYAAKCVVGQLLDQHGVVKTFEKLLSRVYTSLVAALPQVLKTKRQELLQGAAAELSADLERSCTEHMPYTGNSLAPAVLALHFSFTAARNGLGGLSADAQARYEHDLDSAAPAHVRDAIGLLLDAGLLDPNDEQLFGYTPSVRKPFRDCVRFRQCRLQPAETKSPATVESTCARTL